MTTEKLKVIIDRRTWFRGKGCGTSSLLNTKGMMCCLGFACLAVGLNKKNIHNVLSPAGVVNDRDRANNKTAELLKSIRLIRNQQEGDLYSGFHHTDLCYDMMAWNDDKIVPDGTRESELSRLALATGMEFEFIN